MRYRVFYEDVTEQFGIATFRFKGDATAFCSMMVEGEKRFYKEFGEEGNDWQRYVVYDETTFNEESGYGDPVHATAYFHKR